MACYCGDCSSHSTYTVKKEDMGTPTLVPPLVEDPYEHTNPLLAERGSQYGDFRENFQTIADLWNAHLQGRKITPHDVAWMMVLLKDARSIGNPAYQDNYDDAKGYIDLADLLGE